MKRFATLTALLLSLSATLFAGTEKISPDLLPYLNSSSQVQVVVQYAPGSQTSCNSLLGVVDCLLNSVVSVGGKLLSEIPIVNNVVATGRPMNTLDGFTQSRLAAHRRPQRGAGVRSAPRACQRRYR